MPSYSCKFRKTKTEIKFAMLREFGRECERGDKRGPTLGHCVKTHFLPDSRNIAKLEIKCMPAIQILLKVRKERTFPLLPSYLRSHICNLRSPKQVSLQAGARPPSEVGARKVEPGSSVVASSSTCRGKT